MSSSTHRELPWESGLDQWDTLFDEVLDDALRNPDVAKGIESVDEFRAEATRKARVREALAADEPAIRSSVYQEENDYRLSVPGRSGPTPARTRRHPLPESVVWWLLGTSTFGVVFTALFLIGRLLSENGWIIGLVVLMGGTAIVVVFVLYDKLGKDPVLAVGVTVFGSLAFVSFDLVGPSWLAVVVCLAGLGLFVALFILLPPAGNAKLAGESPEDKVLTARAAFGVWRRALRDRGVVPAVLSLINTRTAEQFSIELRYRSENLSSTAGDVDLHQRTPAGTQLAEYFRTLHSGSFALSGPRGAGKTALMNAFCRGTYNDTPRHDLVVQVSAPVDYVPKDFMLHLYASLCSAMTSYVRVQHPGAEDAVRRSAQQRLWFLPRRRTSPKSPGAELLLFALRRQRWIRYLQTVQGEVSGKIGFTGAEIAMKTAVSNAEQAHTFPEIVAQLRADLGRVARAVGPESRVIICVDELDRIQDADRAVGFLNEIKAIFRVPNCYSLVSVSEDALHDFELAAMGVRTVMDSAFDEVLWVDYLDLELAKLLLGNYIVGLSQQYLAFAYVRSGGLARQLVRTARELLDRADKEPGASLSVVVESLLGKDLRRTTEAVKGSLVNVSDRAAVAALVRALDTMPTAPTESTLYDYAVTLSQCPVGEDVKARDLRDTMTAQALYLGTLAGVFRDDLDEARMRTATNPGGSFDALARVRRYVGMNPQAALALLDDFRPWWGLRKLG